MRTLHIDFGRRWRGGQRQCALLCAHLAREGHETHLVCRRDAPLARSLDGSPVRMHGLAPAGEADPFALHALAHLLRELRPDLIAAHEAHAWGLAALARAAARVGAPLVYHRRIDRPLRRAWPGSWRIARTERFVCVSEAIGELLAAQGIERARIRVVHSGTPALERVPGARERVRGELGLGADAWLLVSVGGLIPHKGHALLIDAFARVASDLPRAALMIAGDGPLRETLRRRAAESGVEARVHWLGERRDVGTLLSAADLLVHPSLTEGLGTTLLDAASLGLPIVAARAGGIPEFVRDGETGRLVEPGNAAALAEGIARALRERDATRAMAEAARALQALSFTDRAMGGKTLACYAQVLDEAR
jgi:glycosyltransferase involved in cell wall biosynthesis